MIKQDRTNKTVTIEHENGMCTFKVTHEGLVEMGYECEELDESDPDFWTFSLYEIEALATIGAIIPPSLWPIKPIFFLLISFLESK